MNLQSATPPMPARAPAGLTLARYLAANVGAPRAHTLRLPESGLLTTLLDVLFDASATKMTNAVIKEVLPPGLRLLTRADGTPDVTLMDGGRDVTGSYGHVTYNPQTRTLVYALRSEIPLASQSWTLTARVGLEDGASVPDSGLGWQSVFHADQLHAQSNDTTLLPRPAAEHQPVIAGHLLDAGRQRALSSLALEKPGEDLWAEVSAEMPKGVPLPAQLALGLALPAGILPARGVQDKPVVEALLDGRTVTDKGETVDRGDGILKWIVLPDAQLSGGSLQAYFRLCATPQLPRGQKVAIVPMAWVDDEPGIGASLSVSVAEQDARTAAQPPAPMPAASPASAPVAAPASFPASAPAPASLSEQSAPPARLSLRGRHAPSSPGMARLRLGGDEPFLAEAALQLPGAEQQHIALTLTLPPQLRPSFRAGSSLQSTVLVDGMERAGLQKPAYNPATRSLRLVLPAGVAGAARSLTWLTPVEPKPGVRLPAEGARYQASAVVNGLAMNASADVLPPLATAPPAAGMPPVMQPVQAQPIPDALIQPPMEDNTMGIIYNNDGTNVYEDRRVYSRPMPEPDQAEQPYLGAPLGGPSEYESRVIYNRPTSLEPTPTVTPGTMPAAPELPPAASAYESRKLFR